ncbi:methyltransferase domain-containing protein [Candidatus Woesearchaeota archaeon]|nr:methyltransferase domain-containing protein [Candidatus Woesearchaeota archaeon]
MELKKLNLGCGKDIKKGYINLDQSKLEGVDVAYDLNKFPWPFPKNYFDEIYARDAIEHLKDIFKVMREINRISKPGATVKLIVPYWHSSAAFYPNHYYFFNVDSLKLFTEKGRSYDNHYGFKLEKIKLIPSRIGWLIPPIPLPKSIFKNVIDLRHLFSYIFGEIIVKIEFTLKAVKDKYARQ